MLEQDRFREDLTKLLTPLVFRNGDGDARDGPEVDIATWYNTPGVTVAAATSSASGDYHACHAEWGARRLPDGPGPDADTLFQACSISKAFQSLAILRYVSEGVIAGLDDPVRSYLPDATYRALLDNSVRRGTPEALAARLLDRMTVAELLSHTAGTTTHGFQGYPSTAARFPSTTEVLQGGGRGGGGAANSPAVLVHGVPGLCFSYSGGGSTVLQALLEHVGAGADGPASFPALMQAKVLGPLGMARSFYCGGAALPPSEDNYAAAYHNGAQGLERGEYHVHPEQGAAGLWTTPRDLVRGMTAFAHALLGTGGGGAAPELDGEPWVRPEVARQILLRRSELAHGRQDYYCGFNVEFLDGEGELARDEKLVRISHSGGNYGYRCWAAAAFPFRVPGGEERGGDEDGRDDDDTAAAAVTVKAQAIMTNSNYGGEVIGPLMLAVSAMLDSPLGSGRGVGMAFEEATPAVALDPRSTAAPGPTGTGWGAWEGKWEVQDRTQTLRIALGAGGKEEEKETQPSVVFSHLGEGISFPLWAVAERKGPERTRLRVGALDVTLAFGWDKEKGEATLVLCTGGSEIKCLRPSQ